ncbi:MAG: trimethylamine methyltransferase family protein [Proteobacteria bacterium]|nr:trimethylamine methyltransferase family protein [Pseudomonadota bacterium]MBU1582114.1 trimethylamine methyltransferase family protein [Pseudomonadota bacterium]MBU2453083.1 trimethylamine methyltransferase family protein [Pseudomonadota bacterium]MBU2627730.1 trimethylamine methyltransferase family protein [Pseudomonadota bacterium]
MSDQVKALLTSASQNEAGFEFASAKKMYSEITTHFKGSSEADVAQERLCVIDELIREKQVYQRIDENAKKVLTDIGVNIAGNQRLMDILMEADAVNFESETAISLPLKRDYLEACLEKVSRHMPGDPGKNAFGTGATPPFLKRPGKEELRAATKEEFQGIVNMVKAHSDVVKIFSLPVATDKSITGYEAAKCMDDGFKGLKMTAAKSFADDEMVFLKGKDDWLDGTSLITSLAPMDTMVEPFIRSVKAGVNLLLLDLSIAGSSAPGSPEALLTQIHAQVMFMMVMAQTLNPGVPCIHGGIPGVDEAGGDLSYSSKSQPLINAAMARLNQWITKFPSAQSGGSTSLTQVNDQAVLESAQSRDTLRKYGVHILRHAMGALGSLNYFSQEKFIKDCEMERKSMADFANDPAGIWTHPLYFPEDPDAMAGIREIAEKGNPKYADHTLKNVESFMKWEKTIKLKG